MRYIVGIHAHLYVYAYIFKIRPQQVVSKVHMLKDFINRGFIFLFEYRPNCIKYVELLT